MFTNLSVQSYYIVHQTLRKYLSSHLDVPYLNKISSDCNFFKSYKLIFARQSLIGYICA